MKLGSGLVRGTGRTLGMLEEALSLRGNAEQLPILVCGVSYDHCGQLIRTFVGLAIGLGMGVEVQGQRSVVLDGTDRYEFRSLGAGVREGGLGRLEGAEYSHIFIDHYVEEVNDVG